MRLDWTELKRKPTELGEIDGIKCLEAAFNFFAEEECIKIFVCLMKSRGFKLDFSLSGVVLQGEGWMAAGWLCSKLKFHLAAVNYT